MFNQNLESRTKINVLANESIRMGDKSTLIVFLRASVDSKAAPINFLLDLIELKSLCAFRIAYKIVECLLKIIASSSCSKKYSLDFSVLELA